MPPILDNLPPEELHEVSWAFQKQQSVVRHQWHEAFVFTHLCGEAVDETEDVCALSVVFSVKLFQLLGSNRMTPYSLFNMHEEIE